MKTRNRSAQDATLINQRAVAKRVAALEKKVRELSVTVKSLIKTIWPRGAYLRGQD